MRGGGGQMQARHGRVRHLLLEALHEFCGFPGGKEAATAVDAECEQEGEVEQVEDAARLVIAQHRAACCATQQRAE